MAIFKKTLSISKTFNQSEIFAVLLLTILQIAKITKGSFIENYVLLEIYWGKKGKFSNKLTSEPQIVLGTHLVAFVSLKMNPLYFCPHSQESKFLP